MLQVIAKTPDSQNTERLIEYNRQNDDCLQFVAQLCLSVDSEMSESFHLDVFSHDVRLILQLLQKPQLIIKDAWLSSKLSSRAFHELLKRMAANGIVEVAPSEVDRRAKSIGLTSIFRTRFKTQLLAIAEQKFAFGTQNPGSQEIIS